MNLKIIILAVLFVLTGAGQVSGVGIDSCTDITSPGTYTLTQDIIDSNDSICIDIIASNVVFDGAGHTIDGIGSTASSGVMADNSADITVKNLGVTDWGIGIDYDHVVNGGITNNIASNNHDGIYVIYSSNVIITNNILSSNVRNGIAAPSSSDVTIENNTITSSTFGIYLCCIGGFNVNVINNTITAGSNGFWGIYSDLSDSTIVNNTIYSNSNTIGIDIDGPNERNTLIGNTVLNGWYGILLDHSSNNILKDNTASNNQYGIYFDRNSNSNTITNNTANSNSQYGIYLYQNSNYNNLTDNTAINNDIGIHLESSSNNNLTNNTANSNAWYGILLRSASNYNNLTSNNVSNNYIGILLNTSSGNSIYNNYFNNTNNFYLNSSTNDWNTTKTFSTNIVNGPYLGGNFWAKPNGNGFSETCTDADSDEICDSSHTLASGNVDYLPLSLNFTTTVANAGPDFWVTQGEPFSLNGSGSYDLDGDPLSYSWTDEYGEFTGVTGVTPLISDGLNIIENGTKKLHDITLTVSDGRGGVDNDTVEVTVIPKWAPTWWSDIGISYRDSEVSVYQLFSWNEEHLDYLKGLGVHYQWEIRRDKDYWDYRRPGWDCRKSFYWTNLNHPTDRWTEENSPPLPCLWAIGDEEFEIKSRGVSDFVPDKTYFAIASILRKDPGKTMNVTAESEYCCEKIPWPGFDWYVMEKQEVTS